jgi:hypothetical protein
MHMQSSDKSKGRKQPKLTDHQREEIAYKISVLKRLSPHLCKLACEAVLGLVKSGMAGLVINVPDARFVSVPVKLIHTTILPAINKGLPPDARKRLALGVADILAVLEAYGVLLGSADADIAEHHSVLLSGAGIMRALEFKPKARVTNRGVRYVH